MVHYTLALSDPMGVPRSSRIRHSLQPLLPKGYHPGSFRLRSFLRGGQGDTPFCAEWFDGTLRARIAEDRKASSAIQHELLLTFNQGKLVALQRIAIQVLEKKTFSK